MDWGRSYTADWRIYKVNPTTWADGARVKGVDAIEVTRTADGNLLESGSITASSRLESGYYRVVMLAEQDGGYERHEIATLLFEESSWHTERASTQYFGNAHSVLYPAASAILPFGSHALAGTDGAAYVESLLDTYINAPVANEASFTLNEHVVFDLGTTVLDAAWMILLAGGCVLQIDGYGTVRIVHRPTEPALVLNTDNAKLVIPGIDSERDISGIPNRYMAYLGNLQATATNDSETSPLSVSNRGFYVDAIDTEPIPVNGETLYTYAVRKLQELSTTIERYSYTREYAPDVNLYDVVESSLEGMEGALRITQQSYTCGYGVTVSEEAVREVDLWQ